ncbi:MAG: type II toxin-antitoxin system HigB family toxin [Anaerolineaceae bacterium]|nr:type II toxin-antitoxin system HigB family toxin [Anaerolineaceae bacterium]
MRIITRARLRQFWEKHADAEDVLRLWYQRANQASWQNILEVQRVYPAAEIAGRLTIFDIKGHSYRLIVRIEYERREIYIRHVLTHEEYSKNHWKKDDWY